jgi:hypothetical protein
MDWIVYDTLPIAKRFCCSSKRGGGSSNYCFRQCFNGGMYIRA